MSNTSARRFSDFMLAVFQGNPPVWRVSIHMKLLRMFIDINNFVYSLLLGDCFQVRTLFYRCLQLGIASWSLCWLWFARYVRRRHSTFLAVLGGDGFVTSAYNGGLGLSRVGNRSLLLARAFSGRCSSFGRGLEHLLADHGGTTHQGALEEVL